MEVKQTQLAKWFHKNGYEPIAPLDFYRAIFPAGELATYVWLKKGQIVPMFAIIFQ